MCGIFGGFGINLNQAKNAIDLIKRGDDGITISQLTDDVIFAARRHLVKKSGNDYNKKSDQPYFSDNNKIALIFNGEFYNFLLSFYHILDKFPFDKHNENNFFSL